MDPQTMTDEQIHQLGIEALVNQLGLLGTIRFLQQYRNGRQLLSGLASMAE